MNYQIVRHQNSDEYFFVNTDFPIDRTLEGLIGLVRGVSITTKSKYHIMFSVAPLVGFDKAKKHLTKIMDAYIVGMPHLESQEDADIAAFANENKLTGVLNAFNEKETPLP